MKPTAFSVMSTKPAPDVSTCNVALAISCGVASAMVDIRRGMGSLCVEDSALLQYVLLHRGDHFDQPVPCFLDERTGPCKVFMRGQPDGHVRTFVRRREICRRPRRRRLFERRDFPPQRRDFVLQTRE